MITKNNNNDDDNDNENNSIYCYYYNNVNESFDNTMQCLSVTKSVKLIVIYFLLSVMIMKCAP